jgi:2-methylisocitrate lyase-like PEP mutase family enzyme
MSKCKRLHDLIAAPEILAMPGAYDALSARLIEASGFKACQVSGFGVAASMLGLPDLGFLSLRDQILATQLITHAVDVPVMADGDTGFGNAVNVYETVRMLEEAGAAGVNLEDQTFPKRCGHMDGKVIIRVEEMVQKIRAAVKAKRDPHFVINARTDAIATSGVEEAIRRGNAYADAGATMIFVEAPQGREDIQRIVRSIAAPVSINMVGTVGGKTPILTLAELQALGVARASYPIITICSAAFQMRRNLEHLASTGSVASLEQDLMTFGDLNELVGLPQFRALSLEFEENGRLAIR